MLAFRAYIIVPGLELNLVVVFAAGPVGDLEGVVQVLVNHVLVLAQEAASAA